MLRLPLPVGGYYGCDDCCHTSIAIEHNRGAHCQDGNSSAAAAPHAGRGSVSGCPSEYSPLHTTPRLRNIPFQ